MIVMNHWTRRIDGVFNKNFGGIAQTFLSPDEFNIVCHSRLMVRTIFTQFFS
jgi:hypothetical protein